MPPTEQEALTLLRDEGFEDIQWESLLNWTSPYDFRAKKEDVEHLIEVKPSINRIFKSKLRSLKEYNKPVLFLIINGNTHNFLTLEEVFKLKNIERDDNKEKVYEVLREEGDWMSIVQVAKAAGLTRTTASAYLHVMAAEGRIEEKKFAQACVFRVKKAERARET